MATENAYLKEKSLEKEAKIHNLCESTRNYIAKAQYEKALAEAQQLLKLIGDTAYNLRLVHLESRYNKYAQDVSKGIISSEENQLMLNKITDDFLILLQGIELHKTLKDNKEKIENIESALANINAKLSLNIEIAKERITKLGECWSAMYGFENKLFRILERFIDSILEASDAGIVPKEIYNLFDTFKYHRNLENLYDLLINTTFREFIMQSILTDEEHLKLLHKIETAYQDYDTADFILEKNKFWLGFEIYTKARNYHDCYPSFLKEFKKRNYSGCLNCLKFQKDAKGSIEESIQIFQDSIFKI